MNISLVLISTVFFACANGVLHARTAPHGDKTLIALPGLPVTLPAFGPKEWDPKELDEEVKNCVKLSMEIAENIADGIPEERYLEEYHRFLAAIPDLGEKDLLEAITFRMMARASYQRRLAPSATVQDSVEAGALVCLSYRRK